MQDPEDDDLGTNEGDSWAASEPESFSEPEPDPEPELFAEPEPEPVVTPEPAVTAETPDVSAQAAPSFDPRQGDPPQRYDAPPPAAPDSFQAQDLASQDLAPAAVPDNLPPVEMPPPQNFTVEPPADIPPAPADAFQPQTIATEPPLEVAQPVVAEPIIIEPVVEMPVVVMEEVEEIELVDENAPGTWIGPAPTYVQAAYPPPYPPNAYPPPPQYAQPYPPQPYPPQPYPQSDSTLGGLIPKNSNALASYYIGLFSLLPCVGLPMGVAALILGFKGLQYANQNPQAKGKTHAWVGIVCGGFWTLVWGLSILGIILAAASSGKH